MRSRRCSAPLGLILLASTLVFATSITAQQNEDQATEAAKAWLANVDAGAYGTSWDGTADFFKMSVTKEAWEQSLDSVRKPLGEVQSREVRSANYTTSLPNAPEGEYVVIEMQTAFDNMPSAVETVVCMRQSDGGWKVAGYFIR
ncbi:MAG: DUF4019 domain-containing protein [Gemmatimonadota bacterium]|nr:MAG: DUF4019 domain-containing protein [Gemmatimonadota bacterium]